MRTSFNIIIIGKGMIGSATAKYLSQAANDVALIGPDEPEDVQSATVYASHYDDTRVQRIIGKDITWTKLCKDSVEQYANLERETGIQFHYKPGCLYISPHGMDKYLEQVPSISNELNLPCSDFDATHFPYFNFPVGSIGILENAPAGYINPRNLIRAQSDSFKKNKGTVLNKVVNKVSKQDELFRIETIEGDIYFAEKIVLCPGAFSNFMGLLPKPLELALKSETVLLAEITAAEATRLKNIPSLLYELFTDELNGIYLLPPYQYPDGKYYMKIGCNLKDDITFTDLPSIQQWFRNGNSDAAIPKMKEALLNVIPSLQADNYTTKRCIIAYTAHGHPYIGETEKNLYVATGGCGYAAMCSDGIGAVASHLVLQDNLPIGYSMNDFEVVFAGKV